MPKLARYSAKSADSVADKQGMRGDRQHNDATPAGGTPGPLRESETSPPPETVPYKTVTDLDQSIDAATRAGEQALHQARQMFQRVLLQWASDVLLIRQARLDLPQWDRADRDAGPDRLAA